MDHRISLKDASGASLIEICLTIVVITVTALIIMSVSRSTFSISKDARGNDVAYLSAEKKIAELSKMAAPAGGSDADTIDNMRMVRSWTVKDTNNITRVIVTVTYQSLKGTSRSIILAGAIN